MRTLSLLEGAQVVLQRDAAWALAAAGGAVALLSFVAAMLAWRAARRARKAVHLLEELRRTVRRPAPSVIPGPLGGQVPVMVPPETVFPPYVEPAMPAEPPSPEPEGTEEDAGPRIQRPPPDISRYEVRLPAGGPRVRPTHAAETFRADEPAPASQPDSSTETGPSAGSQPPVVAPEEGGARPAADETGVLLQALEDQDPFVRSKALSGLAGRPGVDPAVIAALGDEYPMVRREAIRALRHARTSQAAQALVDVVSHDPSAEVREEAVSVLAELLQRGASENS